MEELLKKEEQLIFAPLEAYIYKRLLDGFKNKKGQEVIKVDGVSLARVECDNESSEFKKQIVINRVDIMTKVWVNIGEEATTNNQLVLSIYKQIILEYDFTDDAYLILNEDELALIDSTLY